MRTASEMTPRARPVGEPALHVVRHAPAGPSAAAGPAHAHSRAAVPTPRFPGAPRLRLRPLPWDLVAGGVRALLSPCLVLKALGLHSLPPPPTCAHSHSHTHTLILTGIYGGPEGDPRSSGVQTPDMRAPSSLTREAL